MAINFEKMATRFAGTVTIAGMLYLLTRIAAGLIEQGGIAP